MRAHWIQNIKTENWGYVRLVRQINAMRTDIIGPVRLHAGLWRMRGADEQYEYGILIQTVGILSRSIDYKAYMKTEEEHKVCFLKFIEKIKSVYPEALCLGAGGCRICVHCAYPGPCRFPRKACSSMEAYGLFVTQVCRDNHMDYYYGPQTITYTACVLF